MKFSVIIPIHNKLPHLERSINSVLNQTFQDFEIILIDDASTDGSSEKIKEFNDSRISVYTRGVPGPGGYAARNMGIEKAQGEWVAFLDADDEWFPDHLEKMNELALKYPDVYFMSSGWETDKRNIRQINSFYKGNVNNGPLKLTIEKYLKSGLKKCLPVWTSVAMVKKSSPMVVKLFPAESGAKRGGDLHAWLKLICYHKEMAWSNHIGAVYYLDSVNMVTKNASFGFILMDKAALYEFDLDLEKRTRTLLIKYLNMRIRNTVIALKRKNITDASSLRTLYWKGDFINSAITLMIYFLPINILKKNK